MVEYQIAKPSEGRPTQSYILYDFVSDAKRPSGRGKTAETENRSLGAEPGSSEEVDYKRA